MGMVAWDVLIADCEGAVEFVDPDRRPILTSGPSPPGTR